MSNTSNLLAAARDLYAANPSHAVPHTDPAPGTYCVITALCTAETRLDLIDTDCYLAAAEAFVAVAGLDARRGDTLARYNADASTEEVLAVFDATIAGTKLDAAATV